MHKASKVSTFPGNMSVCLYSFIVKKDNSYQKETHQQIKHKTIKKLGYMF